MSNASAALSLQQKVSMTLLAVMATLALVSYAILKASIAPAFEDLEQQQARTNLVRVERALAAELDSLVRLSIDWGPWDDAYNFIQGQHPAFERSNLLISTLLDLQLNLMLFYNLDGSLRWGRLLVDQQVRDISSTGVFQAGSSGERQLRQHASVGSVTRGLLQTGVGPMLLTSNPILHTDGSGPIAGTVILGRILDDGMLAELRQQTEVNFDWHPVPHDREYHRDEAAPQADLQGGVIESGSDSGIDSYKTLPDLNGVPLLVLHTMTPRSISALGHQTLNGALLLLAAAAAVVTIVIWQLLRKLIVKPVERLTTHIIGIGESGDLSKRMEMGRADEIGALSQKFDEMTGELEDAHTQLLGQSFKAGKADTAAEVLHNIRNAMTPVINGIDRLGIVCSVTKGLKVEQAAEQLGDSTCPEERKEKLLQYLRSAFQHIEESHAEGEQELQTVSTQARQVEAILSDQERHAQASPVIESLNLNEMLDEAVLVLPKRKTPQVEVEMPQELGQFRIKGHRVGLLQVLGNIILNAYEAIQRSSEDTGRIVVRAATESVDGAAMIRLTVCDTGCGFDEGNKQRIFQRGYSSKSGRSSGLGLHWCANALAAMGGRIQAESTGADHGAEFHVLLPAAHGV